MHDYRDCYGILGVPPDTDWETLRAHYKRLIRQWHPDRFPADIGQQKIAEERSKQITAAYRALEKYRRDHGVLPPMGPAVPPVDARRPVREAGPVSDREVSKDRSEPGATGATVREVATRGPGRRRRVAFALSALIAALYLGHRYLDAWAPNDNQPEDGVHEPGVAPGATRLAESPGEQGGISAGSTFGDVYAIQGIPTLTQGDTWHYGRSQIRFAHGKVISWNEDPDNPLRIARNQPVQLQGGNFKLGSTKDEVRATQGTPVTETATVWDYGLSRVYFEHNRVVRWEESPMQPLHVPH
jgi:hypothetical protein